MLEVTLFFQNAQSGRWKHFHHIGCNELRAHVSPVCAAALTRNATDQNVLWSHPWKITVLKSTCPSLFVATATCRQPLFPCSLVKAHCFHASVDDTSAVHHLSCTLRDSLNYRSGLHTYRSVCFVCFLLFFQVKSRNLQHHLPLLPLKSVRFFTLCLLHKTLCTNEQVGHILIISNDACFFFFLCCDYAEPVSLCHRRCVRLRNSSKVWLLPSHPHPIIGK